jgi:hypothetical protein
MADRKIISKDAPPDVIEQDIARTRGEMSNTIDEIQERLSARHWKGVIRETIREKMDRAAAGGRELADRARESARTFGRAARERSLDIKEKVPRFVQDKRTGLSFMAFELGAWLVIAARGAINKKRELRTGKTSGPTRYAKAKIMSIEDVEQKVEKAALSPEEGFRKAA